MAPGLKKLLLIFALIAVGLIVLVVALIFGGRYAAHSFFYPKPAALPPVVSKSTTELLAQLQKTLEQHAPKVAQALQPGLSDAQITALENQGGFKLSADLRDFYRWHDGITNRSIEFIPGHDFVPLEYTVNELQIERDQSKQATTGQRALMSALTSHRDTWISILPDGASDGYFYDPARAEDAGSFFYSFAETRTFLWFPSFRNFLAGAIECYDTGDFKPNMTQAEAISGFEKAQKIWERYGTSSE